jgi:hypothetical protein
MYSTLEKLTIDGEDKDVSFTLYLLDDGTFKYEYSAYAPIGVIGNYIIDNDTIILNYLFSTNSGTDLEVTEGTKKLIITDDEQIIDNNYKYKDDNKNIDSIKLSYKGEVDTNFNIYNTLKNSLTSEKNNTNSISKEKINKTIEKYLGEWTLGFNNTSAEYTNANIKKSDNGYVIDIFINKEADYKNLELHCTDNSGVCYATGDENHHFSIVMANELVTIVISPKKRPIAAPTIVNI